MAAQSALRVASQHAAQQQLMLKEQNRSPSAAMQISWACDKIIWSMLCDPSAPHLCHMTFKIAGVDCIPLRQSQVMDALKNCGVA
jgi:hypothetical protein